MNDLAKRKKVAVGLSGGVDSSVSAYLLQQQGYEVTAVFMKCWDMKLDGCAADEDKMYAVQSAAKLGIKIEVLDFVKEYNEKVISYFYSEYSAGRTPNPDVMCNKEIKFGIFLKWAMDNGFDYIVTGHYARVKEENGTYSLLKGVDASKDQSYFLYNLDQASLSKVLFPIGDMKKKQVREIATEIGLPTAARPDSTGICFIGEVNIKEFLKQRVEGKSGNVLLSSGEVIGTHEGIWFYTIGQRHGFTVSKYQGKPLYIIDKNVEKNELIVGEEKDCYIKEFELESVHWVGNAKQGDFSCDVRVRHLGQMNDANVSLPKVVLDKPAFGIASGQSAVFYEGDVLLGGGIIK